MKKIHEVVFIPAGLFQTACGRYLDGPDKERGTALLHKVTCKVCQKATERRTKKCCHSLVWSGNHQSTCQRAS